MKLACISCSHQSHTHMLDLPSSLSHAATHTQEHLIAQEATCRQGNLGCRQVDLTGALVYGRRWRRYTVKRSHSYTHSYSAFSESLRQQVITVECNTPNL